MYSRRSICIKNGGNGLKEIPVGQASSLISRPARKRPVKTHASPFHKIHSVHIRSGKDKLTNFSYFAMIQCSLFLQQGKGKLENSNRSLFPLSLVPLLLNSKTTRNPPSNTTIKQQAQKGVSRRQTMQNSNTTTKRSTTTRKHPTFFLSSSVTQTSTLSSERVQNHRLIVITNASLLQPFRGNPFMIGWVSGRRLRCAVFVNCLPFVFVRKVLLDSRYKTQFRWCWYVGSQTGLSAAGGLFLPLDVRKRFWNNSGTASLIGGNLDVTLL